jgi:hypothetical protein
VNARRWIVPLLLASAFACKHKHISEPASSTPVPISALKVLFIGNSYTEVNDLPGSFRSMATSAGATSVSVDHVTQGGATLEVLWGTNAPAKIAEGGWTHVVVQGQSVEPCLSPDNFLVYAAKFAAAVKAVHATPVFYETWPRHAGDAVYAEPWSGGTPAAMQKCLHDTYARAATESGGVLSPAGDAWMTAIGQRADLVFYQSDGSHPTPLGTYLTTAVMLSAIAHTPATGVDWAPSGVSDLDRDWLAMVAVATLPP